MNLAVDGLSKRLQQYRVIIQNENDNFIFESHPQQLIWVIMNNKVIRVREIRLEEIQDLCNLPAGLRIN